MEQEIKFEEHDLEQKFDQEFMNEQNEWKNIHDDIQILSDIHEEFSKIVDIHGKKLEHIENNVCTSNNNISDGNEELSRVKNIKDKEINYLPIIIGSGIGIATLGPIGVLFAGYGGVLTGIGGGVLGGYFGKKFS